jgi:hypothetical protein
MSASYNPNMGFQGKGFDSGGGKCNPIDEKEYYNTNYTAMFDLKGGASKKAKKPSSTAKKAKKPSTAKKAKKPSTAKRGGADKLFADFEAMNKSLPYATQTGGTELASEYYTSAQQGSYAPYNASTDKKCGGCKKRVLRGGGDMDNYASQMGQKQGGMTGSMASAKSTTAGGGCGCGYKPKTSGTKRGGGDGYYANTLTGDDAVVEKLTILDGQLDGGSSKVKAKKKSSSSKGATKKPSSTTKKPNAKSSRKYKGGDDSAGVGSDFATTLASRGPCNYPDGKSADLFRIFNKTSEFIPNSMLKYAAAPQSTGYAPDPNPYPRAYNDDFIGGTKKRKPAKKSASSSKAKAKKPAKKSASSSKSKAKKPAKKSASSSKSNAKKH